MADLTIDELSIQIKASVDDATSSINELSEALKSLRSSVSGVQGTLKKAKSSVSGVQKTVNDLNATINKTSKSTSLLDSSLGRIIKTNLLSRLSFRAIANHVNECLDIATDYTEVLNKLNVAMGDCSKEAISFGEEVQNSLGVDMVEWLDYQGTFASMFKGFKVQEDHMAIMSQQLTQLAYDYSSLYNKPVSEAFNKLNSALSGQIKGLKDYGNNVSVAMVQQTALNFGITEQISKLDTATQAYLRYITIMNNAEYTGVFQDMSRTISSTANQMRVLNSMITQFKRALGEIYNIVATALLPIFNKFLGVLIIGFRNLKAFLIDFFNLDDYLDLGAGISSITDSFGETEEAVDGAVESVKKYKKSLQGFDELNVIPSQDASSDGANAGAGGGVGYDFGVEDLPTYDFLDGISSKVMEESQKIYDAIEPLLKLLGKLAIIVTVSNWVLQLAKAIKTANLVGKFSGIVNAINLFLAKLTLLYNTGGLSAIFSVLGSTLLPIAGLVIGISSAIYVLWENFDKVIVVIKEFVEKIKLKEKLDGIKTSLKPLLKSLGGLEGIFSLIGEVVLMILQPAIAVVVGIFDGLITATQPLIMAITGVIDILGGLAGVIDALFKGDLKGALQSAKSIWSGIIKAFTGGIATVVGFVAGFVEGVIEWFANLFDVLVGHSIVPDLVNEIVKCFSDLVTKVKTTVKNFVNNIIGLFVNLYNGIVNKFKEIKTSIVSKVKEIWNTVSEWFKEKVAPKFTLSYWRSKFGKIATAFGSSGIFTKVKEIWGNIKEWFKSKVAPKFTLSYWSEKFSGIGSGFKKVIKNMINSAIDMMNKFIGWLNEKLKFSWKGLTILGQQIYPAGSVQLFTIPYIPKLADGGVPNKGQLFYANERGAELVSHIGGQSVVANNQDMLDLARDTMVDTFLKLAMKGNSTKPIQITVNTQLDKKTIAKSTVEYVNGQIKQTGVNPIKG